MERNYDEILTDRLIHLDKNTALLGAIEKRMERSEKRMELTIRRMVKAEERLEKSEERASFFDQKLERSIEQIGLFNKKQERSLERLEQSVKDQREFSAMQAKINNYFSKYINRNTQQR